MRVSIAIIRTKNFTARLIHIGMWLWAVLRGLPTQKCYNHVEVRFGEYTSGAIAGGVTRRKWADYVKSHENDYFKYIDYPLDVTGEQWNKGLKYLNNAENTPYEYESFFWHLIKIITGTWRGDKTTKQTNCSEHAIGFLNATGKYNANVFMNPYQLRNWLDENI